MKHDPSAKEIAEIVRENALLKRREDRNKKTIAALRKANKEANLRAFTDDLTGLMTAEPIKSRLQREMIEAIPGNEKRKPRTGAKSFLLCALDLRGFRRVNNMIGHVAGDDVLKNVAHALKESVRTHDLVGRVGGDEFWLVLWDVDDISHAQTALNRIIAAVRAVREGIDARIGCVFWRRATGLVPISDLINTADQLERKLRRQRKTGWLILQKMSQGRL